MKIKVLVKTEGCSPVIFKQGDFIDLVTAKDVELKGPHYKTKKEVVEGERQNQKELVFDSAIIPLGVAMEMPKGFEGILVPRSSTFKRYGIMETNGFGEIDWAYNGDEDEWKMPVIAFKPTIIPKGTRIAQFRIQLSQKATIWQKLKWLLSSGVEIVYVPSLGNKARYGFGSTGK